MTDVYTAIGIGQRRGHSYSLVFLLFHNIIMCIWGAKVPLFAETRKTKRKKNEEQVKYVAKMYGVLCFSSYICNQNGTNPLTNQTFILISIIN
jgi:hypothetical protein